MAGDQGWHGGTWVALGVALALLSVAWLLVLTWSPQV
jgi:hypothetical protein